MSYEVKVLCNHQRNNTYLLHNYFTQWLKYSLFFLVHFIRRWRSQIPVHTGQAGQQRKNCLPNSLYSFTEKSIIIPPIYWHLYLSRLPKQKSWTEVTYSNIDLANSRGWVIIIWTGLNIKIGITHILFELCLFWYLAGSR